MFVKKYLIVFYEKVPVLLFLRNFRLRMLIFNSELYHINKYIGVYRFYVTHIALLQSFKNYRALKQFLILSTNVFKNIYKSKIVINSRVKHYELFINACSIHCKSNK